MRSLSDFKWDAENQGYFARHRLSNGQFCMIGFYQYYTQRAIEYGVAFAVADKKKALNAWFNGTSKDTISLKMTGRCGVEALLWCRDKILEFENEIQRSKCRDTKITISATDSKRFRMYEKALTKYGYKKAFMHGTWLMVKSLGKQQLIKEKNSNEAN